MASNNDEIKRESDVLIRESEKPDQMEPCYPKRYTVTDFENYFDTLCCLQTKEPLFLFMYNMLAEEIDYDTCKPISLRQCAYKETELKQAVFKKTGKDTTLFFTLSKLLKTTTAAEYNLETEALRKKAFDEWTRQYGTKKEKYLKRQEQYKKYISFFKEQVLQLPSWNDYIEFEGEKYGFPYPVHKDIHRFQDCMGTVTTTSEYVVCNCHRCENWGSCGGGGWEYSSFCNKCRRNV